MNGRQIFTLEELEDAAKAKRAVVVPKAVYGTKPRAASFYIGWPGRLLLQAFSLGMFIYEKDGKQ